MQKFIADYSEELGYRVIYGDTDSIFIQLPESLDAKQCKELSLKLEQKFNEQLRVFTRNISEDCMKWHSLQIEFQSYFPTFLITAAKKKYIGMEESGDLYIKGFELIRKDTPDKFKAILMQIVKMIMLDNDILKLKDFISAEKQKIKDTATLWDLRVIKRISKSIDEYKVVPQHVRAAVYSNTHFNTDLDKSDYSYMIYTIGNTDVMSCPDAKFVLPSSLKIDFEKYFTMFINGKIEQLDQIPNIDLRLLYQKNYKISDFI